MDPANALRPLERALFDDIRDARLIPYIQLHEFEALLFSDISKLAWFYSADRRGIADLQKIRAGFPSPEDIDDGENSAPSKRIRRYVASYEKVVAGPGTAQAIGILKMKAECPHFSDWVTKLERLRPATAPTTKVITDICNGEIS